MTQDQNPMSSSDSINWNEVRIERHISPGWTFLTAALFGYFGFLHVQIPAGTQLVPVTIAFLYTFRGCAVLYALAGVVALMRPEKGAVFNAVAGVACVGGLITIGVLDLLDAVYTSPIPLFLLCVLIVFNGWMVTKEIQFLLAIRKMNRNLRNS